MPAHSDRAEKSALSAFLESLCQSPPYPFRKCGYVLAWLEASSLGKPHAGKMVIGQQEHPINAVVLLLRWRATIQHNAVSIARKRARPATLEEQNLRRTRGYQSFEHFAACKEHAPHFPIELFRGEPRDVGDQAVYARQLLLQLLYVPCRLRRAVPMCSPIALPKDARRLCYS